MKRLLGTLALGLAALGAQAQDWPQKPVTLVVPFPAGGSTDMVARAISPRLGEKLGQSFLVDNKAGATGTIGATFVKRAAPDGATFLVTSLGPLVIAPHLIKGMQYDALKDFDPITVAVQAPNVLVVPAKSPFKTVAEVIANLKAHPGKMTFASSGNGSSDHLTAELFWQQTGTQGLHVPYKGGAPAITDLLGGQVDASFQNVNAVVQNINAGKLRALAVTGDKRSPVLPDVPTTAEAGVKNLEVYSWQAIVAPKGLPPALRSKAHDAMTAALNDPAVKQQFTAIGLEVVANTPEQFAKFQQQESARWKKVIETGKITID
ncbi:Bug family tripartite tricarboxylate transporter substrate binding protein [Variovorax ginsengisoli]|uniref:Tripartite tricarboxylate transporter substrate binding protein n=1 Tax=Variovorax ginsengisoli TaxID=363844 RepID=A0ABT8S0P2_9BURK|nr:tripartite tricarboxylate transporter substrate binding protein [Variovorax ginsengisoli]MDN8613325.1 tripartite tricarboxylate transporter substrate binding protein [Variovorax ginsengisoli]MDO1532495.1 tripartite tricarboxylate transporter substrate binding protein [Variovorax ginsengisoli]HET7836423.1 tripartite tricarboxylate transporter substrate binding protein [Variovorax sp.]